MYAKFKNGKYIFLILYVDDILLASSDVNLLLETKKFLSSNFDMKDLGEPSFVLGIEIHRDRSKGVLGLSQKAYIERILKKFSMHKYSPSPVKALVWFWLIDETLSANLVYQDDYEIGSTTPSDEQW